MTPELPIDARRLPEASGGLVLAFSGGLDSTALLHALATCAWARQRGLRALHVDHGLQAESSGWAEHCAHACRALSIECAALRITLDDGPGGLEDRARRARYRALSAAMQPGEVLITAHHQDDQAETFLLRALRGAGEAGLAAMRPLRRLAPGWLWRPLLQVPRQQLCEFAEARGLQWVEDPSNLQTKHDRNFLRQAVLPLLRQRWPQATAQLALSAHHCRSAEARLAELDAIDLANVQRLDPRSVDLPPLRDFDAERRARVLRAWLTQQGARLPAAGVMQQIERELLHARAGSDAEVRWGRHRLRAWRDGLHLQPEVPALPAELALAWDGSQPLALPDGHQLQLRDGWGRPAIAIQLADSVQVRARSGGERLRLAPDRPRQAVRNLLQQLGVPPWQRPNLPYLWSADGELLAVADLVISERLADQLVSIDRCLRWIGPYGLQDDLEQGPSAD